MITKKKYIRYFYFLRNSILFMKTYFKFLKKIDLIAGFLTINLKKAVKLRKIRTYVKAIIEAYKVVPSCRPHKKLKGELASKLAGSWHGDPSLSRTLRRILCIRFR